MLARPSADPPFILAFSPSAALASLKLTLTLPVDRAPSLAQITARGSNGDNIIISFYSGLWVASMPTVTGLTLIIDSTPPTSGTWVHLAITVQQTGSEEYTSVVYYNGAQASTHASTPGIIINDVSRPYCWIGQSAWTTDPYFYASGTARPSVLLCVFPFFFV